MKIEFIIYSHFFKERGMKVKGDWNFPHLPRIGEEISPHIIMFQNEFTYQNLLEYLTDEAKSDFNKFNDGEDDLEGNFKEGDFVLHLAGIYGERMFKLLKEYTLRIIK
jgi:hypothetical protein